MNALINRLRSFTPIEDLAGEFESPYPLPTCLEHIDALENGRYDVRGSRKAPLAFTVYIEEKATTENGDTLAKMGTYYQAKEDTVAWLDLKLTSHGEKTAISYRCHLRDGLKNKLYIHLIVIFVLVVLTLTASQGILFFGIFFLITIYTILQEWSELKNVKEGLVALVEHASCRDDDTKLHL